MGLTKSEIKDFREELKSCHRSLFFFDDDPDGIVSYLLMYKSCTDAHGVILKTYPKLDEKFLRKVDEFDPDTIFVLDIPMISKDFITSANRKIVWLDHHQLNDLPDVKYFNPRKEDQSDGRPTSYWAYKITENSLWLAMAGCISDWHLPDFKDEFIKEYPNLLSSDITKPDEALYGSRIGELARILSFMLKGNSKEAMTCIKILNRIESPYEILDQTSSKGKYIYKKYVKFNQPYQEMLATAKTDSSKILKLIYDDSSMSFTSELSNELIHKNPDKIVMVCRKRNGEMKCSIRSADIKILPLIEKSLSGVEGYGGGHELACGACIKEKDFEIFLENFKGLLK